MINVSRTSPQVCAASTSEIGLAAPGPKRCTHPEETFLFFSILFYSLLFFSILFYSLLFSSILFYSLLFSSLLFYYIVLYYITGWGTRDR